MHAAEPRKRLAGASVLVTGASGLVGRELVEQLERAGCEDVVGVSRRTAARTRESVAWDMSSEPAPRELSRAWDAIVHTAANTRWTMSHSEAFTANVKPIEALAPLACERTLVVHVSTAYATGLRGGGASDSHADYRNSYEWSKARGERLARELFARLAIVRPPLTIGRRSDGVAARFSGMYLFLRGIATSSVPAVVGVPDAFFDVVPVDDLARGIVNVIEDRRAGDGEVITVAGGASAPRLQPALEWMLDALNRWRTAHGLTALATPPLLSPERWRRFFLPFVREHLTERQLRTLELLRNFEAYLQLSEPLDATYPIVDVEGAIRASVDYWATTHPRIAALDQRGWSAAAATRTTLAS